MASTLPLSDLMIIEAGFKPLPKKSKEDGATDDDTKRGVGVLVIKDGRILCGTRMTERGKGLLCGPGGHIKSGESPKQAAFRETEEEFGISPKELIYLGRNKNRNGQNGSHIFLCTVYNGYPQCVDGEMSTPRFLSMEELEGHGGLLYGAFGSSLDVLRKELIVAPDKQIQLHEIFDAGELKAAYNAYNLVGETAYDCDDKLDKINKSGIIKLKKNFDIGTAASGNWGHQSVKGVRGGSAPGGGKQYRQGNSESGYTSEAKEKAKKKAEQKQASTAAKSAWGQKCDERRSSLKSLSSPAEKAAELVSLYGARKDSQLYSKMLEAVDNSDTEVLDELIDNYFDKMEENGDPTPTKPTCGQLLDQMEDEISDGTYYDTEEARLAYIKDYTGVDGATAEYMYEQLNHYFDADYDLVDTGATDDYIAKDDTYDDVTYKGLSLNDENYEKLMKQVEDGTLTNLEGTNGSMSSTFECAESFARPNSLSGHSVMWICVGNKTGAPVNHISYFGHDEDEVLNPTNAQWTPLYTETVTKANGKNYTTIYCVEKGDLRNE